MNEPPINKTLDMQFSSDSLRPPPYYFWLVCFPIVNKVSPLPMTVTSLPFPLTWTAATFQPAIFLWSRFSFSHEYHLLFDFRKLEHIFLRRLEHTHNHDRVACTDMCLNHALICGYSDRNLVYLICIIE